MEHNKTRDTIKERREATIARLVHNTKEKTEAITDEKISEIKRFQERNPV